MGLFDIFKKSTKDNGTFFFHEDDYCMIELTPKANINSLIEESKEIIDHAEKHFDGQGFTDIHLINNDNRIKLDTIKIDPELLAEIINKTGFTKATAVTTGAGQTYREDCENTFAFGQGYSAIYYSVKNGIVDHIWLTNPYSLDREKLTDCLYEIGQKWELVLMDWFQTTIVSLSDKKFIEQYIDRED